MISDQIFRECDIRGIVDQTFTEYAVHQIGQAVATKALQSKCNSIIIGRDGRLSSDRLAQQLLQGITITGCNVIDLGLIPTPLLYFAMHKLDLSAGIMLTGSHNPPNYNGSKIILNHHPIYGQQILELKKLILEPQLLAKSNNRGQVQHLNLGDHYIQDLISTIRFQHQPKRKLKIIIDCGNGAAGVIAEKLFTALGLNCIGLYCDVDGNFPNHHPDPMDPPNLTDLINTVLQEKADLGICFDGDGDRLGVIDNLGNIIWPDYYFMLFIKDLLKSYGNDLPKPIIMYDVKSTKELQKIITQYGGEPLMCKTGHSLVKATMRATNAILAGEMSGHIYFKDRWFGFDDALYAAARLVELIINSNTTLAELIQSLPKNLVTPELSIIVTETTKTSIIKELSKNISPCSGKVILIDGVRLELEDCWGIVRSSNTTPHLIARFEGKDLMALQKIQNIFKKHLMNIAPNLILPF